MANMSHRRNMSWLTEQQDKLARLNAAKLSSTPANSIGLTNLRDNQQESLAFSNPIYDEFTGYDPSKENNINDDEENIYVDSESVIRELIKPVQKKKIPIPKPRRTKVQLQPIDEPPSPEIYENVPPTLEQSDAVEQSTSFLYIEKEFLQLPAKMAQLLNEIESLADSLASSDREDSSPSPNPSPSTLDPEPNTTPQLQSTFRRKRIQVQKELFKFSMSSGSDITSPIATPDLIPPSDLSDSAFGVMGTNNKDSGIFSVEHNSSGDSSQTNLSVADVALISPDATTRDSVFAEDPLLNNLDNNNKTEVHEPLETKKKSIPHSPPPKLPPRKPVRPSESSSHHRPAEQPPSFPSHPPPPIPSDTPLVTETPQTPQMQPKEEAENKAQPQTAQPSPPQSQGPPNQALQSPPPPQPQPQPQQVLLPLNTDLLSMEHLHMNKLSLQRSGYLWKTGPNYKSFKYRWCILYRHNLDLSDANFSYYFNRSSISASLSGKIMIAEIEFICVCESVPLKTKVPKLEKSEDSGGGVCFLEIGVRSRQGRVYLFAARANIDRQLWMHAFVQALCLHAFKNKELYHFGFLRAKFTITASWQNCFALLTTDRFLYIFEMLPNTSEATSMIKAINCKNYHIFNLRKTVRISRLDEPNSTTGCSPVPVATNLDCKSGFSLTQNGGRVVYIVSDFESHINRWYRSITKFWQTPEEPEKMLFEEQYLTKDNIPVAIDKCLKFLDTFNLNQNTHLFTNVEQQHPMTLANSTKLLAEFRVNAWNVHLLPHQHSANQISLLLLLFFRSMNQCIFTESLLCEWIQLAQTIEQQGEEQQADSIEAIKKLLKLLPQINYATLRRVIICLANANINYPLSSSLCKAMLFSKQKTAMVPMSASRTLLTTLIKNHLYLFEVTKEEVDKEMHIKRVVHLIINQQLEDQQHNVAHNIASPLSPPIIANHSNDYQNQHHYSNNPVTSPKSTPQISTVGGPPNTIIDTRQVNSLIIGIRVSFGNNPNNTERTVVNVHLSKETCADDVLDMVLEKADLDDDKSQYSLFEVVCYRRLERVIMKKEKVLPVVLSWSNWPSHWCAEAALEVRHSDTFMKGSLALLHNKEKYANILASSTSTTSSPPPSPKNKSRHPLKRTSQSVKCRPTNPNYSNIMMSIIRYCGQNDTRMAKKILAEFSASSLFLYCKESHQLLGQHGIDDFYWYIGIESSTIAHTKSFNTTTATVSSDDVASNNTTPNFTTNTKTFNYSVVGSSNGNNIQNKQQQMLHQRRPTAPALMMTGELSVPALTLVEKRLLNVCQSKDRLNFGQTLVFNSWNELYQWIRALLQTSVKE